ncbi:MAG: LLM class flavin-dependent oxidoreductase [Deltaproteobacteria bacterium]|nr:LLM class flavin-dependent oxidoreductase [Deltaproteobacteria bacterium]
MTSSTPRLGMVLYHGIDSGDELRNYARVAEEAGFDSLWVTERYFHEETFSLLGFLAAATRRIRLGLGVTNPYTRNPALLGMSAATLDRIAGGRFLLGLGRSDKWMIEGRMGMPYERPLTHMKKTVAQLRQLLSGERVSGAGVYWDLKAVRLAVTPAQESLPIYLAAIGPKALRLAGAVADGVLLNAYVPTAYVRYAVREIASAAREAGRDPAAIDIACMLIVRLTDDPERMMPALKERMVRLLAEPFVGEVLLERGGFDPGILPELRATSESRGEKAAVGLITEEMVGAFYLLGDAATCRRRIAEYREAGVEHALLLPRLEDYESAVEALGPRA